jgi:uncharacterized protein
MLWSLVTAAFVMGLVGGPHCLAMCGGTCGMLAPDTKSQIQLQFARLLGYGLAGAILGAFASTLAWATQQVLWLKPIWTLLHVVIFAWGLVLLIFARQPQWIEWPVNRWIKHVRTESTGVAVIHGPSNRRMMGLGAAWPLMPCGLLYSAYFLAALSGGALQGALVMTSFACATVLWLIWLPLIWRKLKTWRQDWGMRLAGLMLVLASGWAVFHNVVEPLAAFCVTR